MKLGSYVAVLAAAMQTLAVNAGCGDKMAKILKQPDKKQIQAWEGEEPTAEAFAKLERVRTDIAKLSIPAPEALAKARELKNRLREVSDKSKHASQVLRELLDKAAADALAANG